VTSLSVCRLEHLQGRLASDKASCHIPTLPTLHPNYETFSVISSAMEVFETHMEVLSWAERRAIALLLERYAFFQFFDKMNGYIMARYAALEDHFSVIRPSLIEDFQQELYSAAQHVHEQIKVHSCHFARPNSFNSCLSKLICDPGGERLPLHYTEVSPLALTSLPSRYGADPQFAVPTETTSDHARDVQGSRLVSDTKEQALLSPPIVPADSQDEDLSVRGPVRRFRDEDEGWNYAELVYEDDPNPPPPLASHDIAEARPTTCAATHEPPEVAFSLTGFTGTAVPAHLAARANSVPASVAYAPVEDAGRSADVEQTIHVAVVRTSAHPNQGVGCDEHQAAAERVRKSVLAAFSESGIAENEGLKQLAELSGRPARRDVGSWLRARLARFDFQRNKIKEVEECTADL
jgi:hypothetical protein